MREGLHHLTFLDGLMIKEVDGVKKTKFGHMYSRDPKLAMPLRTWGEGGYIKIGGKS